MNEKIVSLLKDSTFSFPKLLLLQYKAMNLTEGQLLLLIYLINYYGSFNPKKIGEDLGISLAQVMEEIGVLSGLGYVKIEMKKIGNVRDEVVNLDGMYEKLAYFITVDTKVEKEVSVDIFSTFESEFGRPLSPMEYEIIHAWLSGDYTEEVVMLALKEAIYNGVTNLRYIDKILHDWNKKGIHTKEDVMKSKKSFQTRKVENQELFDYDWLNENG